MSGVNLADLLTSDAIRTRVAAANWEEAVREAGQVLVATGGAEPRYVQAMVDLIKQLGPYMVIAPGIALAHARPESGANRIGLALLTLATPVYFGNADNDPVDIVVGLAAVDSDSHVKLLAQLALFLNDSTNLTALHRAQAPEEIVAVVGDFVRGSESSN